MYQSSTVVADPRGNETSYAIVTADLLTCYLRVAEADLLHLFHPLHFDCRMHHPTGTQFLFRARVYSCRKGRKISVGLQPLLISPDHKCLFPQPVQPLQWPHVQKTPSPASFITACETGNESCVGAIHVLENGDSGIPLQPGRKHDQSETAG